jgi:hyperosmotically inducible periplasmic protein
VNTKLATTLVIGALLAPVAACAAEKSTTQTVKEAVADSVITTKIKAEFAKDKQVSAMSVKVDTDDKGVVTLSGNAKSKAEADQAVKIARDTKGVTSVRNDIVVQAK